MTYYLIVSTAVIFFGGVIWSKDGLHNQFIKLVLFAVGGYGVFVTLQYLGYILHK